MNGTNEIKIVDERKMDPAVERLIRNLLCECFPADAGFFSTSRIWHGSAPEYSVLGYNADVLIAHVGIIVRNIIVGDTEARIAGIQNMAVSPGSRKSGIGLEIIEKAMAEARRRNIKFSVLFCVPALEKYYSKLGWHKIERSVWMDYDGKKDIDVLRKNICMVRSLAGTELPEGGIHLCGADW